MFSISFRQHCIAKGIVEKKKAKTNMSRVNDISFKFFIRILLKFILACTHTT